VKRAGQLQRLQTLLAGFLILILAAVLVSGCRTKYVRQEVPAEDVLRAKEIEQEGNIAFARADYYAALIKYLEAMRLNPYDEQLLNRLGIAYAQLKFYNEARQAFQRAVDLDPKLAYAVNNMGSVYFAQQNLGKAEKHFKKAIRLKKDEPSFYMNLAALYLEKKKTDKALAEWKKALAIDTEAFSKSSSVSLGAGGKSSPKEKSFNIARLYASMGNVELVIENLEEAFEQGFSDIQAIEREKDFNAIRKDPRFVEFIEELSLLIRLRAKTDPPIEASPPLPVR
jgi:tetratricopeptide (TPR) repeat protein